MSRTLASPGEPLPGAMNIGRRRALRIGADRAALTVLLLAACMAVLTFRDYGVTWDEPGLRTYGQMLVAWYRSGFADGSAFSFANLRYYGGAFDIMATLLEPWTGLDPYAWRHLLGAVVGLAGLALTWRLGRRLGGPGAGLMALLLLATLPGWWGHMFFNSKDVPFAVGMLASLAIWVRCLEEWPEPRLRSALLLGLAVGLTLGVRVGGIMLGLIVAPSLALLLAADARRFGWSAAAHAAAGVVLRLLPALPVALAVLLPAWPWVALAPGNFLEAVGYLSHFPYSADTIFAGQRYPAPAVPLGYWPTLLALQLPEVVLAGLLLAAVVLGKVVSDQRQAYEQEVAAQRAQQEAQRAAAAAKPPSPNKWKRPPNRPRSVDARLPRSSSHGSDNEVPAHEDRVPLREVGEPTSFDDPLLQEAERDQRQP